MSLSLYLQIRQELARCVDPRVSESTLERLTLLVTGIIGSESTSPSRIARAVHTLGLSQASAESIERRIRRTENDPQISATLCLHPLARQRLLLGRPERLLLVIDPTSKSEEVLMLTVSVWYRGRALPLAWLVWPANHPLEGERFWERVAWLLEQVSTLLPQYSQVIWLADRAFGTPQFIDLVTAHGWDYVVRVQGQTRCRDEVGVECTIRRLVQRRRQRRKLRGWAFKKRGWRKAAVVVYWGRCDDSPLCLVTSLGAKWEVLALYRRRYAIEATFRDYKSKGWQWERNQVTDLAHTERLLVGLAIATWLTVGVGAQVARELLARPATPRRTRPDQARYSLFTLGLQRLREWWRDACHTRLCWHLTDWSAPNWSTQVRNHYGRAFVFQPVG